MTQLILDTSGENIMLPESQKDGYHAEKVPLSVSVPMISGRTVLELRGEVWAIRYQYGFLSNGEKEKLIAACEKGRRAPITCGFLPAGSDGALLYSDFYVTTFTYPKFMWSRHADDASAPPIPVWADFSLELREVEPGD